MRFEDDLRCELRCYRTLHITMFVAAKEREVEGVYFGLASWGDQPALQRQMMRTVLSIISLN